MPKLTDSEILARVPEALRAQVASDLANVRAQSAAWDSILSTLAPHRPRDFHDDSDACPRCGVKHRGTGCRCSEA